MGGTGLFVEREKDLDELEEARWRIFEQNLRHHRTSSGSAWSAGPN